MTSQSAIDSGKLLYLGPDEVDLALREVDVLGVIERTLIAHGQGRTLIPEEAYLPWTSVTGAAARSLNMPGCVDTGSGRILGTKIINASYDNSERGMPRAGGLTILFDPITARPTSVLAAGRISALRTAAVSALAVRYLAPPEASRLAIIGAGVQADTHLELLADLIPHLDEVRVYDVASLRAGKFAERARALGLAVQTSASVDEAVRNAHVVVTVTTSSKGYIPLHWLAPGTLVCHVSLDDLLPDALLGADLLVIDDWTLVSADRRRILGRLIGEGRVRRPGQQGDGRVVDAELGQILAGQHPGRESADQRIVVNPFGMAVEDIALAREVVTIAQLNGIGSWLDSE
jgi:N-[(2S)-2-amino-2-carboxyethyl]-L-glutamate dehydrogenase